MIERILDYIKHNNLVSANDKLLIAVSGGVDSMVLANILHKLKFNCKLESKCKQHNADTQINYKI